VEYIGTVTVRVHDIRLLAITQLPDQGSLLQISARRKYKRDCPYAGRTQRRDKRMLAFTRIRHDRDNHIVAATCLARSEREHDRFQPAHLAGSNDMKNGPPRAVVAYQVGAIYTYC
jgi:hypothetical protein